MTIEMPGGVQKAFEWLGLEWPQADEDKLFAAGDTWTSYAGALRTTHDNAYKPASTVWTTSTGEATDAFHAWWTANPDHHLPDDADGADLIGAALSAFGAVTIALKMAYIAQLIALAAEIAQAVAMAFITFGASLAEIPVFAATARLIVKEAVEKAVKEGVQATVKGLFTQAEKRFVKVAKREIDLTSAVARPVDRRGRRAARDARDDTRAGLSYFGRGDKTGRLAPKVKPESGQFTLDLHGTPDHVIIESYTGKDRKLTAQEFAEIVKADPKYQASAEPEIRLMACETGQRPDGFAQQLADALGKPVHAPNELGWSDRRGNVWAATEDPKTGKSTYPPDGQFLRFDPRSPTPGPPTPPTSSVPLPGPSTPPANP